MTTEKKDDRFDRTLFDFFNAATSENAEEQERRRLHFVRAKLDAESKGEDTKPRKLA